MLCRTESWPILKPLNLVLLKVDYSMWLWLFRSQTLHSSSEASQLSITIDIELLE